MERTSGVVHLQAVAQRIQTVALAGEHFLGHDQGVNHPIHKCLEGGVTQAVKLLVQESQIKRRVVNDDLCALHIGEDFIDQLCKLGPKFAELIDEILAYVQGAEVIIHNAPFDLGFLNKEFDRLGHPPFKTFVDGVIDTLVMAKEMFPGKRNSLDALCDRLEVDNSGRTLHGALLDAELLADVYINLTRGQEALLMETSNDTQTNSAQGETVTVDLSAFTLPVVSANEQELQEHVAVLTQMDKSSAGKTVWRLLESAQA